jgi:hypothetical protein
MYCVGQPILTSYESSNVEACIYYNSYGRVATIPMSFEHKITYKDLHNSLKKQSGTITLYDNLTAAKKAPHLNKNERIHGDIYKYQRPIFAVYIIDSTQPETANNIAVQSVETLGEYKKTVRYNPSSYYGFFKKNVKNNSEQIITDIKSLINDYAHPVGGWFFTFHWFRHHRKLADKITKDIPNTVKDAYRYLCEQRQQLIEQQPKLNMNGSFMRRLNFALAKLADFENTYSTLETRKESYF